MHHNFNTFIYWNYDVSNPKYGLQFIFDECKPCLPQTTRV